MFISGQLALQPGEKELVPGDITEQTEQVFANLTAILEASGSSLAQTVLPNDQLAVVTKALPIQASGTQDAAVAVRGDRDATPPRAAVPKRFGVLKRSTPAQEEP